VSEPQYREALALVRDEGAAKIGEMAAWAFHDDPKRLAFTLARYKFVAKMLAGKTRVLEIGCGDAWASRVVRQAVDHLVAVDFDLDLVASARACASTRWPIDVVFHDMVEAPLDLYGYDAAYSLDCLEHVPANKTHRFITNIQGSLSECGVLIVGMPSLESQAFASEHSRRGHIKCMAQVDFRNLMLQHFANVFMFSMNDEVVHTGHAAMSHYNIALCC
jgi:cyclopropane fatty-acyl-phospholipid synthase-like methyltransferase